MSKKLDVGSARQTEKKKPHWGNCICFERANLKQCPIHPKRCPKCGHDTFDYNDLRGMYMCLLADCNYYEPKEKIPEPKTEPEKNEEPWECPICHKTVYIGYTTHKHCLDKLMEEPEKSEYELWSVQGYDDCNMKIPVKYADVIRINLSYIKEKQKKELIEKFQTDLDSLNPDIPYSYEPLNKIKKKWQGG